MCKTPITTRRITVGKLSRACIEYQNSKVQFGEMETLERALLVESKTHVEDVVIHYHPNRGYILEESSLFGRIII
jgi:hypothetical protein